MENAFTIAAYVVAAVLFILSLGGLSGQESAKRAVWYGIAGMAIAVLATLIGPGSGLWLASLVLIAGGGGGWLSTGHQSANDANAGTGCHHALARGSCGGFCRFQR